VQSGDSRCHLAAALGDQATTTDNSTEAAIDRALAIISEIITTGATPAEAITTARQLHPGLDLIIDLMAATLRTTEAP
jgi:hypothetical protein